MRVAGARLGALCERAGESANPGKKGEGRVPSARIKPLRGERPQP